MRKRTTGIPGIEPINYKSAYKLQDFSRIFTVQDREEGRTTLQIYIYIYLISLGRLISPLFSFFLSLARQDTRPTNDEASRRIDRLCEKSGK